MIAEMSLGANLSHWLQTTAWATALRESEIVFSLLLVIHVLGLVLLAGTIFVVDLRLLGWRFIHEPVIPFTQSLLRVTWAGFGLLAVSGFLLFAAQAGKLYTNPYLRAKFVLLGVVGLNALVFNQVVSRKLVGWESTRPPAFAAKLVASVSLVTWLVLIAVSRFIPYFDSK